MHVGPRLVCRGPIVSAGCGSAVAVAVGAGAAWVEALPVAVAVALAAVAAAAALAGAGGALRGFLLHDRLAARFAGACDAHEVVVARGYLRAGRADACLLRHAEDRAAFLVGRHGDDRARLACSGGAA